MQNLGNSKNKVDLDLISRPSLSSVESLQEEKSMRKCDTMNLILSCYFEALTAGFSVFV